METERCPHEWQQQTVDVFGHRTPVARWVCGRCADATDSDPHAATATPWDRRSVVTFGGSGSWSLRTGDSFVLDAVVHLRDAATLPARAPGAELRAAVRELWPVACAASRRRDPGAHRSPFGPELPARVVDDVGFDRDVPPGALHGRVVLLDVRGAWWALTAPGSAVASHGAVTDPRTAHALLRAVFESGLG